MGVGMAVSQGNDLFYLVDIVWIVIVNVNL